MCCCEKTLLFLRVATTVIIVTFLLHLIGYSAPYWCQTSSSNKGLWEVCENGVCMSSLDTPVLSDEVWFIVVQSILTMSIATAATAIILVFVMLFTIELADNRCILVATMVMCFMTMVLIVVGLLVYVTRGWVFFDGQSGPDFTFGFALLLIGFAAGGWLVAGTILSVYLLTICSKTRKEDRDDKLECVVTDERSENSTLQPEDRNAIPSPA